MAQIARSSKQLGNLIQRARRQKGLTQTELAGLSGLRQELISKIEGGKDGTKLSSIYALFAALDLELLVDNRSRGPAAGIEDIF
ncbi:helix-turn-helix domain-containing protein [Sphingopyxis sp. PAMC25046]|uniref:helix-turn-helix domain-containing protein n=1 Tax=Sphingopyxis sp. PAMC25046 TaxID=2565556 RepID=UPI00109E2B60|nr:helix-turn-helix domain-containing protein [Sphingopyxis sp. PAMC25046]QCB55853.1 helix-turn-helix domain-containing protein [Sphingopyxis sp. PAMC25046]